MNVRLDAILAEVSVPLEETLQWKPGSVLPHIKIQPIQLKLGQKKFRYSAP